MLRYLFFFIFSLLQAESLSEKYPNYMYVLHEFDIEKAYINDSKFHDFAIQHERGIRELYKYAQKRGENFIPTMKNLLLDEGVSDIFIYLSIIESGLHVSAISPKKAVGLWQFMPNTAKLYDLVIENSYDERKEIISATIAAAKHLNTLYTQFGKWYLAAMAYNCGEGCLKRAIERAGTDALRVLLDEKEHFLPKETRLYIKKILLVALIGEEIEGVSHTDTDGFEKSLIEVEVSIRTRLAEIAKLMNITLEELQRLNPNLTNKRRIKGERYRLNIPLSKAFEFFLNYDDHTPKAEKEVGKSYYLSHTVMLGESLESIAKRYHAEKEEIMIVNRLESENLMLKQLLLIPVEKKLFDEKL